ncbi:MAG: PspA/IM30 family protein [bacterium]
MMNVFRRVTATLTQSIDKVVDQIENQDAVAEAALRQVRKNAGQAKVRLAALARDRDELAARLDSLRSVARRWTDRAARLGHEAEDKALECLRRRRHAEARIAQTEQVLAEYDARVEQLGASVAQMEERLLSLTQKRAVLRTRDAVSNAQCTLRRLQEQDCDGLDAIYERWEARLLADEYGAVSTNLTAPDTFERDLDAAEEQASLQAELAALLNDAGPAGAGV